MDSLEGKAIGGGNGPRRGFLSVDWDQKARRPFLKRRETFRFALDKIEGGLRGGDGNL